MTTSRTTEKRSDRRLGFTLVELLLVCVLIGVLVSVALPRLGGSTRSLRFEEGVRELADLIRFGRAESVKRKLKVQLNLDRKGREYSLSVQDPENTYTERYVGFEDSLLHEKRTLPEGIQVEEIQIGGSSQKPSDLYFTPDGFGVSTIIVLKSEKGREAEIELGAVYDQVLVAKKPVLEEETKLD